MKTRSADLFAWLLALGCLITLAACGTSPTSTTDDEPLTTNAEIYTRLAELPRHYKGTFEWDHGGQAQRVEIWFETVRVSEDGTVWVAEGRGVYRSHQVTHIDIRARINPDDGRFRMWESNPDQESGFVTSGTHIGEASDDFRRINATWNGDDGNLGDLELRAVDEASETDSSDDQHPEDEP